MRVSIERSSCTVIPPSKAAEASQPRLVLDPSELPDRYGVIVRGVCMEPEIQEGSRLIFDKSAPYKPGDLDILWKRPELVKPGQPQAMGKRLYMAPPSWVKFPYREHPESGMCALLFAEQLNPPRNFAIPCEDLLAVHRCVGVMREIAAGDGLDDTVGFASRRVKNRSGKHHRGRDA